MTVGELKSHLADIDDDIIIYDENMDEIEEFEFIDYPDMDDQPYIQLFI